MISWIQSSFQHHFRTVFAVLLAVTIISFIFTIGASPGIGRAGHQIRKQEYFGFDLSNQGVRAQVFQDAEISVLLQAGFMPFDGNQLQTYTYQRLAALHLADEYRLPAPTPDQLTAYIITLRAFQNEQGRFDQKRYTDFSDQLKGNPRMSVADVTRVMDDDYRIGRVHELVGGPGYVLTGEIANQLALATTAWTFRVAEFDYSAFTPAISTNDETLAKYFEENSFRYEVKDRVNVDYVTFKAGSFAADATFTPADLEAYFQANQARFAPAPTDPTKPAANAKVDLASVRPQVEAAYRLKLGSKLAENAANDFEQAVYDQKVAMGSPALAELASHYRGVRDSAPAFTDEAGPANLSWPPPVVAEAFRLGASRFFSDPLPLSNGDQIVLLWKETLPAYKPALLEVRDRVLADYRENERRKLFVEAGRTWKSALTSALAGGTPFDAALASLTALGAPRAEVKNFGPCTRMRPPEGVEPSVFGALDRITPGGVSDLLVTATKGYLVQLVERKTPPSDPGSPEYAAMRTQLTMRSTNAAQAQVLGEIVEQELRRNAPPQP